MSTATFCINELGNGIPRDSSPSNFQDQGFPPSSFELADSNESNPPKIIPINSSYAMSDDQKYKIGSFLPIEMALLKKLLFMSFIFRGADRTYSCCHDPECDCCWGN
ncbi:hypothetical protein Ciccas_014367 [Cichlidogyrus casuarinus]|uniref:Uncharacterized protein n=1 Tax=Cichlidogyrus casuarinus TaxID=1844966 RepID=A0ABD2PID8_9PLAT